MELSKKTTFGERLQWLRKTHEVRLKDVSKGTGISIPFLSDVERDSAGITLGKICKIARYYEISLERLFLGVEISS